LEQFAWIQKLHTMKDIERVGRPLVSHAGIHDLNKHWFGNVRHCDGRAGKIEEGFVKTLKESSKTPW